jgi:hypothetical protein
MKTPLSNWIVGMLLLLSIALSWYSNGVGTGQTNILTWDVYGYYLPLPALVIYGDTKAYAFTDDHFEQYAISTNKYQLNKQDEGVYAPIYTIGMAILWLPFFLLAHGLSLLLPQVPPDGMSWPYQVAVVFASWVYAAVGWWYLRKFLLRYLSDGVVALTLGLLFIGTNYFHYLCFEPGMPHSFLFALYALVLYHTSRFYEKPDYGRVVVLGVLMAMLCVARPSEGIVLLLFFGYGLYSAKAMRERGQFWRTHFGKLVVLALTGIVTVLPQVIFWKINLGVWVYNGYEGHHFDFLAPHLWDGLFSYRKGWLLYTPLMALSLVGIALLYRHARAWFWPILAFTAINLYVVYSWHIWWYASTFGSRAVIQSYAVLALPFGLLLQQTVVKSKWWRIPVLLFAFCCVLLNQFQDWQYRQRILPFDETTKTYYWAIFGKTELPAPDVRKYLDVDEKMPVDHTQKIWDTKLIIQADSTNEWISDYKDLQVEVLQPDHPFSQAITLPITTENIDAFSEKWLQATADVYATNDQFIKWKTAYLVTEVSRNGESLKWVGVRFQRYIKPGEWESVQYETQLPVLQEGDTIKIYIWNQGPDTIYLNSLMASIFVKP